MARVADPNADVARAEAEAALPAGWRLERSDHERFSAGKARLDAYSAAAAGPAGEVVIAIALDEASAYRALVLRLRGELAESAEWAPPTTPSP
jgi:hypothetical protein